MHETAPVRPWRAGLLTIVASVFLMAKAIDAQVQGFPLTVENPTASDLVNVPVSTGIPLPYYLPVIQPDIDFALVDDNGQPVPSHGQVLARWFGKRDDATKHAKWVLTCFNATVPANSSRTYYIVQGPATAGQVAVDDQAGQIVVDTGVASFTLDKTQFSLFDEVKVGSQVVTSAPGALEVRDTAGNLVTVALSSTVVEEPGTVRVVVRQKGTIPSLGLAFTVRYFFFTGHTDCKVDFRLENNGSNAELPYLGNTIDHAHFEDLRLVLHVAGTSGTAATLDGNTTLGSSTFKLEQKWSTPSNNLDMLSGFSYTRSLGASSVGTGARYEGAIALNRGSAAASVSIDRFWQNFPKAFELSGDRLDVVLWPGFGSGPAFGGQWGTPTSPVTDLESIDHYRFEAGRWKTHTMVFDFKTGGQTFSSGGLTVQSRATNKPLMALPPRSWPFQQFAFGDMIMERRQWFDTARNRYERMMDVLARDSAADNQPSLGQIGLPGFRNRGGTYGGSQMYGWENFGDVAWGDGYSSLHYDLVFGVLINFYRTGDYAFFDIGRELAAHRRDYDQNHTKTPGALRAGGQSYEKGFFHGNYDAPTPSHTWVHGLLLQYVMTGDEGARESAIEVGDFIKRQHPESWDGWWGARILGWQIEGLCNLYNYIGDSTYKDLARTSILRWDTLDADPTYGGTDGSVPNPAWTTPHAQTWMHAIVLNAMCKYALNFGDPAIKPCVQRLANFLMDRAVLAMPTGVITSRVTGKVWERIGPNGYEADPSTHHIWGIAGALSWASVCTGNPAYISVATDLFESIARYHQVSAGDYTPRNWNDPTTFSPIAFRMQQYPNAETKIMSNIALWGQSYVMARTLWDHTW